MIPLANYDIPTGPDLKVCHGRLYFGFVPSPPKCCEPRVSSCCAITFRNEGAMRLRGTPIRNTCWKQVLIPSPESERGGGDQTAPGLEQTARRAEWEARDLGAEAEWDRRWAAA